MPVIAVGGKGGVGKTAVSAVTTKLLLRARKSLLVIDADPASSLVYALGENLPQTIGNLRERIIEIPEEKRKVNGRPIREAVQDIISCNQKGFCLLVMGQAEGPGCFCGLNDLLRYGIELVSHDYDATLIDCEAGIEQVNRRCIQEIDQLLLVADTSLRCMETASRVQELARKYCRKDTLQAHLIVNRLTSDGDKEHFQRHAATYGLDLIGFVPEDPNVQRFNARGIPLLDLPDDSPMVSAMAEILGRLQMVKEGELRGYMDRDPHPTNTISQFIK